MAKVDKILERLDLSGIAEALADLHDLHAIAPRDVFDD